MKRKILIVVGTRPNFIKVTQFKKEVKKFRNLELKIVHTGQHFDSKMSDIFFQQLDLAPDFFLNIQQGTANFQMAQIMLKLEELINTSYSPDLVVVVGDVNSTLAAALTANKMGLKLAHLESGLRSFDKSMPEEHNRVLTDHISDYFFITEQSGLDNLGKEGKNKEQLFFVGNTMIDTLVAFKEEINKNDILEKYDLIKEQFVLMTMHRPATVDNKEGLGKLLDLIDFLTTKYKLFFPIHPRTTARLKEFGFEERVKKNKQLIFSEPLDYLAFQKLIATCKFILTDSGGIQEESTYRLKPCLTLRNNTERPSTVTIGTNELVPFDLEIIKSKISMIEAGSYKKGNVPQLWDGATTARILEILNQLLK